jgi:hypothetical protein
MARKMYQSRIKVVSPLRSAVGFLCAVAVGLGFCASQAHAGLYVDNDVILKTLSSSTPSHYGNFNILNQGYNPDTEQVIWAGVAFVFVDSDNTEDTVRISLNGESQGVQHISYGFSVFGGLLSGEALCDLNDFGVLSYQVKWLSGDPFLFKTATLMAETSANASVPDGGTTVGMLGLALLGLGVASRKFKAAKA